MPLKLQPLPNIKFQIRELLQAIKDYREDKDYNEVELELLLDDLLCKLPRNNIYIEWYDRSQIRNMAEFDNPVSEDVVDDCMNELWEYNDSIMDNDLVIDIVNDTVNQHKGDDNDD